MAEPDFDEDWEEWDGKTPFYVHMLAGSFAGVAEHLVVFPLDTVKTRLQTRSSLVGLGPGGGEQQRAAMRRWMRGLAHAPHTIFRGVSASLAGCLPAHAAYFSIYESAKLRLGAADPGEHTPVAAAAAGVMASMAHDAIMTPLDVCKQRLQLGFHSGLRDCFSSVVAEEGVGALFRSLPTTMIMNLPYAAVMVATNESMKTLLNPSGENNTGAFLASGGAAGGAAALLTTPLDVAKTRLQTQGCLMAPPSSSAAAAAAAAATTTSSATSATTAAGSRLGARPQRGGNPTAGGIFPSFLSPGGGGAGGRGAPSLAAAASSSASTAVAEGCPSCGSVGGPYYRGLLDACKRIYAEEGLAAFSRGAKMRVLSHAPAVAISWTTYETVKRALLGNDA